MVLRDENNDLKFKCYPLQNEEAFRNPKCSQVSAPPLRRLHLLRHLRKNLYRLQNEHVSGALRPPHAKDIMWDGEKNKLLLWGRENQGEGVFYKAKICRRWKIKCMDVFQKYHQ